MPSLGTAVSAMGRIVTPSGLVRDEIHTPGALSTTRLLVVWRPQFKDLLPYLPWEAEDNGPHLLSPLRHAGLLPRCSMGTLLHRPRSRNTVYYCPFCGFAWVRQALMERRFSGWNPLQMYPGNSRNLKGNPKPQGFHTKLSYKKWPTLNLPNIWSFYSILKTKSHWCSSNDGGSHTDWKSQIAYEQIIIRLNINNAFLWYVTMEHWILVGRNSVQSQDTEKSGDMEPFLHTCIPIRDTRSEKWFHRAEKGIEGLFIKSLVRRNDPRNCRTIYVFAYLCICRTFLIGNYVSSQNNLILNKFAINTVFMHDRTYIYQK